MSDILQISSADLTGFNLCIQPGSSNVIVISPTQAASLPTAGLRAQWKADSIEQASGSNIIQWDDSSGNGYHITCSFGNFPRLETSGVNGKPAVRFDGFYFNYVPDLFSGLTEGEAFMVLKADNDPGVGTTMGLWEFPRNDDNTAYPYTDGVVYDGFMTTARKTLGNPSTDLETWHVYNSTSQASNYVARFNGTVLFSTAANTVKTTGARILGGGSSIYAWYGYIAELIIYDHGLTAGERTNVHLYLNDKYALGLP